jgi:hypothetical protein
MITGGRQIVDLFSGQPMGAVRGFTPSELVHFQ